ncbi:hypothetical protein KEM54_003040, partial [Ascosphaera aggregata]
MAKHDRVSKDDSAVKAKSEKRDRKRKHSERDTVEVTSKKQKVNEETVDPGVNSHSTKKLRGAKQERDDNVRKGNSSRQINNIKKKKKDKSEEVDEGDEDSDISAKVTSKKSSKKTVSFNDATKSPEVIKLSAQEQKEVEEQLKTPHDRSLEKRKKRSERSKNRQPATSLPATTSALPESSEHPILSYLTAYHKSRSTWKYQKIQEGRVLKHALNTERVTPTYNTSLRIYLEGLKSVAAKRRVGEAAEAAIEASDKKLKDQSWSEKFGKGIERFRSALEQTRNDFATDYESGWDSVPVDLDESQMKMFESRKRAELVRFCVRDAITEPVKAKPIAKKRKNRTAVVDFSSSSSSSSSSDNSDSDSENEKQTKLIPKKTAAKSESSSSSSNSDSDSESTTSSDSSSSSSDSSDDEVKKPSAKNTSN